MELHREPPQESMNRMAGNEPDVPDADLVAAAQRGDRGAFDALIGRHFGLVYAVAYARLSSRESAEDLAQEVFLRAFLQLSRLRDRSAFAAWVVRMARNLGMDWVRRGERRSRLLPMTGLGPEAENVATDEMDARAATGRKEEEETLAAALNSLSADEREVLLLHFVHGLSKSEVARWTGVHPSTTGRQLDRAVVELRKCFAGELRAKLAPHATPRPAAAVRAVTLVAAAAALSPKAHAALETAAAASSTLAGTAESVAAGASVQALLKSSAAAFAAGVQAMSAGKIVVGVVCVTALAGGFAYRDEFKSGVTPMAQLASAAPAAAAGVKQWQGTAPDVQEVPFGSEPGGIVPIGSHARIKVTGGPARTLNIDAEAMSDGNFLVKVTGDGWSEPPWLLGPGQDTKQDRTSYRQGLALAVDIGGARGPRFSVDTVYAWPAEGGIRYNYFTASRPDLLGKGIEIEKALAQGAITKEERNRRLLELMTAEKMVPTQPDHRAVFVEAMAKLK